MGADTNIAWTDSTMNPWIGCTNVSPGCDNCYAEALDARYRWGGAAHWGPGVARKLASEAIWAQPYRWNKAREVAIGDHALGRGAKPPPHRVFCASLADVFDNEVPQEWRARLFDTIRSTPYLTWQLLTKRIGNAPSMLPKDWSAGYRNVWIGATMVNQDEVERDMPKLLEMPAEVRFLSYEPAIGRIDLCETLGMWWNSTMGCFESTGQMFNRRGREGQARPGLGWVIVGGESGPNRREVKVEWIRSVVEQCSAAGVPVFVKQDSGSRPGRQGRIPAELWRKEFPA